MQWLRSIWRNLFRKPAVDTTLDEEIRSYLQLLVDEKIAEGTPIPICRLLTYAPSTTWSAVPSHRSG
jgi:hypothetical protein